MRKYVSQHKDYPKEDHWVILTYSRHVVPAYSNRDEDSTSNHVEYQYFTTKEEWEEEIQRKEANRSTYSDDYDAFFVKVATITRIVSIQ